MKAHYRGPNTNLSPDELIGRLLHPPTNMIAVDTETVSLKDRTMLGFGIAISPDEAYYVPVWPEQSEILLQVYSLICDSSITHLGHNYTFDLGVFRQFAVSKNLPFPDYNNIHDTGIMANVSALDADLHTLAYKYSNTGLTLFTIPQLLDEARNKTGKRNVNMTDVDPELVALKCMNDVRTTYSIFEKLSSQLTPQTLDCYQVDKELLGVLKTIERKGLKLNEQKVNERYSELTSKIEVYKDWGDERGFNISSPAQVGMFLGYNNIVLPTTKSGRQLDTSEEELQKFNTNPLVKTILEYRKLSKILSTYVEPFRGQDRAYTHFRLDLATGRLASASEECTDHVCRNQQNVPSELRDIFQPDNEVFTWADMSQLEMRVFAYLSQDKHLLEAYQRGESIHEITFRGFYPNMELDKNSPYYVKAKTGNFAMIFDAQDSTIASQCEITIPEAKRFKHVWFGLYPDAKKFMESKQNTGSEYEETIFGRRMRIPPDYERGKNHSNKCRINYPVQGSGADLNKRAMLKLYKETYLTDARLQVHDEILNDGLIEFPHELVSKIHPDIYVPWEVKSGSIWQ